MPAPTPRELLLAGIAAEPLLVEARIDHALIDYALVSFNDDVPRCTAMFRNYARFHKDYLGHPARRVCIAHVHALYLTKLLFNLPHLTALDGSRLVIYDMAKDHIGGVPKQFPVLMAMYMFHVPDINGSAVTVINCKDIRVSNASRPPGLLKILSFSTTPVAIFLPSYNYTEFTQGDEIFAYVHPSMLPVDFGGNITGEQLDKDILDFIKERYEVEELKYSPIDIETLNWKEYRIPGIEYTAHPQTGVSTDIYKEE